MTSSTRNDKSSLRGGRKRLLGSLAALLLCASAQAQDTNPYYFGGSLGLTHVSNIYRVPTGTSLGDGAAANSDTVTTASLLAGVNLHLGREHLTADISVQDNRYANNSLLDNLGYNGRMGLDWATVNNISGTVSMGGSRQLSSNVPGYGYTPIYAKNVQTDFWADSVARVGLVTRWTLEGDVNYHQSSFTAWQYKSLDYRQTSFSLGPTYRASDLLRIGVDVRHTRTNFPSYYPLDGDSQTGVAPTLYEADESTRNDLDLNIFWKPSDINQFELRLSTGHSNRGIGVAQKFSGASGQLNWNWQPTGRLSFSTQLIRDTGLQSSLVNFLGQNLNVGSQDQITTTVRSYATYQYSAKLSFNASASRAHGTLDLANPLSNSSADFSSTDYFANLGATWQYSRGISFNCSVGRQERTGSPELNPYKANNFGCVGQWIVY